MVNLCIVLDTLILHIVRDHCKIAILAYRVCVVSLCPEVPSPEFVLHVGMCSEDMKRFLLWGFRMWFGFTSSDYQPASPLQAGGERLILIYTFENGILLVLKICTISESKWCLYICPCAQLHRMIVYSRHPSVPAHKRGVF